LKQRPAGPNFGQPIRKIRRRSTLGPHLGELPRFLIPVPLRRIAASGRSLRFCNRVAEGLGDIDSEEASIGALRSAKACQVCQRDGHELVLLVS
jgi:hypothetical protein